MTTAELRHRAYEHAARDVQEWERRLATCPADERPYVERMLRRCRAILRETERELTPA